MPNIFDGLRKISDNDIIEQIALLETINIVNISKPIAQKAKKKTISIINYLGSKIGKSYIIEEPEVKEIWSLIDEKKDELKTCTRKVLDKRLLNILMDKVKDHLEDPTEDAISIEVIEEAAKLFKLYKNLTPAQKADNIYLKYCEKLNGKAKEYLNGQPFMDLKETTEDIREILSNMNEDQKKDFEQSIDVKKLTLLNVWKKLDRQHFARIVWLSVKAYEGRFTPKKEILPSFIEGEKEVASIKNDEDLKKCQRELVELSSKIKVCKDKINIIEDELEKENRLLNNSIRYKNKAEEEIIHLRKINAKLESVKREQEDKLNQIKDKMKSSLLEKLDLLMEEFKEVKFNIININNKISDINIEVTYKSEIIKDNVKIIENKQENIKIIGFEFQKIKIDAQNLVDTYNKKKDEVNIKERLKRDDIFERWSKFFDKFTFEFNELNNVINFSRKELLYIEECMYELNFAKDPISLSMGILEDTNSKEEYQYIDSNFFDNFRIEIQYKILNNKEKTIIHIVGITTEF